MLASLSKGLGAKHDSLFPIVLRETIPIGLNRGAAARAVCPRYT